MCQRCVDAVKKYWPNLPESDYGKLLMGATGFPLVDAATVKQQVKDMAERSGQCVQCAMAISDIDLTNEMRKAAEAAGR